MGGTGGQCGIYAWAHSHVWGAPFRQSSSACRLESIDLVPSLIGAEERAIIRAVGTALYFVRLSPEPQLECGEPGPRTWQPIAGCLGGRGQHPANADGHYAAGEGPAMECTGGQVRRRETPAYYHAGVRSGHATEQPMSVIIVQTDRGARHCLGLVVGGLRGGPSPSGDIFVAGQNIIIDWARRSVFSRNA